MNIRINKLSLQNFKGIKNYEIVAGGDNLTIYGDNATGKTTVFDAFMWLLFGKDSLGRSDFGIKTQDENGNVIHNLEHSVECEMLIDDTVLTLKKVFTEKWTKKRGSAESEFSGHETKYFVNEVPTLKKDYEAKITGIIDEELFKIITNPLYFNEHLKWQDRRAILLNLCNNLSDTEILAQSEDFKPLLIELKGRTVAEYKKIIQGKQSAINDELKSIPQRISEAVLAIPESVETVDISQKETHLKNIESLTEEIQALKNGAGAEKIRIELSALKDKSYSVVGRRFSNPEVAEQLTNAKEKRRMAEDETFRILRYEVANIDKQILNLENEAETLRKKWYAVNEKTYSGDAICPFCKQELPKEQIEEATTKFNTEKVAELESITEKGKTVKTEIDRLKKERLTVTDKADKITLELDTVINPLIIKLSNQITEEENTFLANKEKELEDIDKRIAELEKQTADGTESISEGVNVIADKINEERAKIAVIDKAIANQEIADRQKKRVAELEADEKRLAQEYSKLEVMAFIIEKFIKYKVDLLSEEINSHFRFAKFKLFDVQINGGISECCEVTYRGVPYSDLNNASRINIGIDIINTLCKLNDKYAPVITDNAESITNIIPTTSQMICLVVSAGDKTLRVEKGI